MLAGVVLERLRGDYGVFACEPDEHDDALRVLAAILGELAETLNADRPPWVP